MPPLMMIETGETEIPVMDGALPAFYATPAAPGRYPVILLVHEMYGVYGHLDHVCRFWAELGYFVIAPFLYARAGDVHTAADRPAIRAMVDSAGDSQVAADLDATVAWLETQPKADMARLGLTGFCWGGRHVWLYAARNPKIRAAVAWYGGPITGPITALKTSHPLDVAAALKAPVLGLYGGSDSLIPMDTIEAMQSRLKELNSPSMIHVYPSSEHGFHAPNREKYDAAASSDGDEKLLAWFRQHGVG